MRVGITGHRGLPAAAEGSVRRALVEAVADYTAGELTGLSCLADGPDSWFAQAVLERGGQLEAVVPAELYRQGLPEWHHDTYDTLFARASRVHRTGLRESTERAHMVGSELLVQQVDELLAVWDQQPARGYGGTADVVTHARDRGVPVRILWPGGATRE